ncbi:MAG: undecaprenyl/decaprenyl-phosphate alpha-N-acetylglucosaminyl 1-phosphate transferase, partial [Clostridiales Family XIII bacterium]|nr:undecaprenyl/decaprenyl-phosphate alpha-N-acetylglucosaminyl 1-phosphate transferase [Clostridiales Family XIII bacterium]
VMMAVAGGALGFLPFNFHPARIFMGDGGALFLGFMLASVSVIGPVKSATVIATVVPVLVLGLPIFDTAFAILRRLAGGRPIMEADKGHLHHRLMAAGLGQKQSVLTLYGISGVMGVAAVVFSRDLYAETAALLLIAVVFLYILLSGAAGDRAAKRADEKPEKDRP